MTLISKNNETCFCELVKLDVEKDCREIIAGENVIV